MVGEVDDIINALDQDSNDRRNELDRLEREANVIDLIVALTSASRPKTRQLLCDLLGRIRDPLSLDALLDALADEDSRVRAAAADAVGKIFGYVSDPPRERRHEALAVLLQRWGTEESDAVRSTLTQTLALLGDSSVRPILENALNSTDGRVRRQARWGIDYLDKQDTP